jgi:hypothetical protein
MRILALVVALVAGCDAGMLGPGQPDLGPGGGGDDGGGGGGGDGPPACVPSCTVGACGSDGCGGVCGACGQAELCSAGTCVKAPDGITVDVGSSVHAIAPEVYGLAFASKKTMTELRTPLNRWGGNGVTRYNWELDVSNTASDWYFQNIPNSGSGTFGTPSYVSAADQFVLDAKGLGAQVLMTVPSIGWVAKDRKPNHPLTCGYPVSKYGPQESTDAQWDPDCGNGKTLAGDWITGDPTNTSKASPPSNAGAWVTHLKAPNLAVRYYSLDNEINLWSETHHDLRDKPMTYDDIWKVTKDYAPAIRAADPSAFLMGYGTWSALDVFFSNQDTETPIGNDRKKHGDVPLLEWYLQQLSAHLTATGQKLIDCVDLHYYPQGGSPLENTRSLWDATYRDPSWMDQSIGEPIRLFPRIQEWITKYLPGTGICVSEYNFNLNTGDNAEASLVQADVLGLFGRYGIRLGAWWTTPIDDQGNPRPPYWAFKLYRNYDGAGGAFGGTSVGAASSLPDVAAYAATRGADGALTLVLINKATAVRTFTVTVKGFTAGAAAEVWEHVAGSGNISKKPSVTVTAGTLPVTLAARSMVLVVVPKQ